MHKLIPRIPSSVIALATALLSIVAAGACHDATAPEAAPAKIALDVATLSGPTYGEDANHLPTVTCGIDLRAIATGTGRATWRDATLRFYIGPNHQTLLDTATFSGSEIGPSWSEDGRIAAGDTELTHWDVYAGIPFYITFEYHYLSNDRPDTATVNVACGAPAAESAPLPVVSNVTITPSSGELEAGSPVTVSYRVDAPGGVWRTQVAINGPCDTQLTFNERRETALTRTVSVPIPGSCALGKPIIVTVTALDALAQTGNRVQLTSTVLADHTPPSLVIWFFWPNGGFGPATFHGDFYGGDSVLVDVGASDNHDMSAVVWEVLPFGVRDSVLMNGTGTDRRTWIHFRPEWSGPVQLRFFARDSLGLTSVPVTSSIDSAVVHPLTTFPTASATIEGSAVAAAVDSKHDLLYVAEGNERRISVVSMTTLEVVNTINLPTRVVDIDINQAGDSLAVALWGQQTLAVVDLVPATPVVSIVPLPTLDQTLGETPAIVRIASNGHAYFTTHGNTAAAFRMFDLDFADGTARLLASAGENGNSGGGQLERSLDGTVLALDAGPSCLQRYVVATDSFSACVKPVYPAGSLSLDASGSRIALGYDIYDESLNLLPKSAPDVIIGGIVPTVISADGTTLDVAVPYHGIVRVRTSDNEIIDRISDPVGGALLRVGLDGTLVTLSAAGNYTTTLVTAIRVR